MDTLQARGSRHGKIIFDLSSVHTSLRLRGIQYGTVEQGWSYPLHRHPDYELIVCMEENWKQNVAEKTYTLIPGETILVKAGFTHASFVLSDATYFGFHFQLDEKTIHSLFQFVPDPHMVSPTANYFMLMASGPTTELKQAQIRIAHMFSHLMETRIHEKMNIQA